jgi:UDP-2,4-diacetamido-2,4,6-trideoxy-beta-L-altropyranose hydrolase
VKYTIAFRVDTSHKIGSGHAMRCLTLALALKKSGIFSVFVTRENLSPIESMVQQHGIPLVKLEVSLAWTLPPKRLMHGDFLTCSQDEDARATIKALEDWPDVHSIIVDHYGIYRPWDEIVSKKYRIFKIDDLADREHFCVGLLDQNFYLDQDSRYRKLIPESATQLIGPHYALLRPMFQDLDIKFRRNRELRHVLVSFGGHDREGYALQVTKDLLSYTELSVQVMGTTNPDDYTRWEELRRQFPTRVIGPKFYDNPLDPMLWADLYIGAGGTTTWERFACGLPGIVYSVATNQIKMAQDLETAGFQPYAGSAADYKWENLKSKLEQFKDAHVRWDTSKRLRALVDGHGASRVIDGWGLQQT